MFTTLMDARSVRQSRPCDATEPSGQPSHLLDLSGHTVLLATDGSPCAVAASFVAYELAEKYQAEVHVVSVVDPRSSLIPPALYVAIEMGEGDHESPRDQERAVRAELTQAIGMEIDWPVRIMFGNPAVSIVEEANHLDAALVVLGLRRHGRLQRVVRDETAINVMRTASCPVLGVVAEMNGLPTRILAAVDFGKGSVLAARTARALIGDDATMVFAYVHPMNGFLLDDGEARIHDLGVNAGFKELHREFRNNGAQFDHVVLHKSATQSPGQALLEYAEEMGSDLITAGSIQHSRLDRWMVGSVSAELVRDGRRSVLIVPPGNRE
jgi:nucleotide-binding universal stress UspA family protein